eukprot:4856731-Amphidinium_carterae.1
MAEPETTAALQRRLREMWALGTQVARLSLHGPGRTHISKEKMGLVRAFHQQYDRTYNKDVLRKYGNVERTKPTAMQVGILLGIWPVARKSWRVG